MHEQFIKSINYEKLIEMQAKGETFNFSKKGKSKNSKVDTKSKSKVKTIGRRKNA